MWWENSYLFAEIKTPNYLDAIKKLITANHASIKWLLSIFSLLFAEANLVTN